MEDMLKMTLEGINGKLDDQNHLLQDLRVEVSNAVTRDEEYEKQIDALGNRFTALEEKLQTKPGIAGAFKDWKVLGIAAALVMSIGGTIFNGATDPDVSAGDTFREVMQQVQQMQALLVPPTGGITNANAPAPNNGPAGEPKSAD